MSELIDNKAHRIRTLKEIIRRFSEGGAAEEAKAKLRELMNEVDAGEIAAMEQELIADGMPVERVRSMCDAHSELLREFVIAPPERPDIGPGHPAHTLRLENAALKEAIGKTRALLDKLKDPAEDGGGRANDTRALRELFERISLVDRHYRRKENLIFSVLERHGIAGPSKVMWAKDDEVRDLLAAFGKAIPADDAPPEEWADVAEKSAEPALGAVTEMIFKEEKILLPMCLGAFTDQEWDEIRSQSDDYGYCLIDTPPSFTARPAPPVDPVHVADNGRIAGDIVFPTGNLSFEQLLGLFRHLPVDITYVDADDRVRFFSEGPKRIFERSAAIIGRKVEDCHPPKSVSVVKRIIDDFRSNRQDVAVFWIDMNGAFIHIRYFAVRDDNGEYIGTLEVTQDVTGIRMLEGERRLLQYESPGA